MLEYFINYAGANIVCLIIFGIMLARDLLNVDRQEKQIKYDHALVSFMLYFVSDTVWAAVDAQIIKPTVVWVISTNVINYLLLSAITYMWLRYIMAVEQVPHRERKVNKFAVLFPFLISTVALIVNFIVAPWSLVGEDLKISDSFSVYLVAVPYIYIAAVIIYTMKKAKMEINRQEKRRHIYIGIFPLMVVVGGMLQMTLLPTTPIFCFSCTILMLIIYIQSMETQISIDPLTKLNNRGQILRFISQESSHKDDKKTFVVMIDVNDFKSINDTFGHAEGDKALVIVADSLRTVAKNQSMPTFLGRYGGDEFIIIAHPYAEKELESLVYEIRSQIKELCEKSEARYIISVSAGYDELLSGGDTFQKCIQRADSKLYVDKEHSKLSGDTTVCK